MALKQLLIFSYPHDSSSFWTQISDVILDFIPKIILQKSVFPHKSSMLIEGIILKILKRNLLILVPFSCCSISMKREWVKWCRSCDDDEAEGRKGSAQSPWEMAFSFPLKCNASQAGASRLASPGRNGEILITELHFLTQICPLITDGRFRAKSRSWRTPSISRNYWSLRKHRQECEGGWQIHFSFKGPRF